MCKTKLIVQPHSGEKAIVILLSAEQEVVIFLGSVTVIRVHTHMLVFSLRTVFDLGLSSGALDSVRWLAVRVYSRQQGPPQKPQSAETQPETEPSLCLVELRSHGPTVTVPASVWPSVNVSATGSLSSSPFSSFGAEFQLFLVSANLYAFITERVLFPFPQPQQRYMRRPEPWKAPARALSLHVSTRLCNKTCLGTAPLTVLMFWTSCSCHFLLSKPWCRCRVTVSNCPGRRRRKNLLEGATKDCWCVTQTIHQMFF